MKAFRSEIGNPARIGEADRYQPGSGGRVFNGRPVELQASSEARAILAESEPTLYCHVDKADPQPVAPATRSDMRVTVLTRDYSDYAVAHESLAEALPAFIAALEALEAKS